MFPIVPGVYLKMFLGPSILGFKCDQSQTNCKVLQSVSIEVKGAIGENIFLSVK